MVGTILIGKWPVPSSGVHCFEYSVAVLLDQKMVLALSTGWIDDSEEMRNRLLKIAPRIAANVFLLTGTTEFEIRNGSAVHVLDRAVTDCPPVTEEQVAWFRSGVMVNMRQSPLYKSK
jgi:hypothetical protein